MIDEELIFLAKKPAYFDPVTWGPGSYTWEVPTGIHFIRVDCVGAQGMSTPGYAGGYGGRVQCVVPVKPKSSLYIWVGTQPTIANKAIGNHTLVMENFGSYGLYVLAGGGGSATQTFLYQTKGFAGGAGGGLTGGIGGNVAGTANNNTTLGIGGIGGSQTAGGTGAYFSMYLKSLYAGTGTSWSPSNAGGVNGGTPTVENVNSGGYGGCGLCGGGGAVSGEYYQGSSANGSSCAGGGGGSSYTTPYATSVVHTQGYRAGNGYLTISMV